MCGHWSNGVSNPIISVSGLRGIVGDCLTPLVAGGNVDIFRLDPLSNRVVYSADQDTNGKFEIYSVPVVGGTPLKLNPPIKLTGGGDAGIYSDFAVNPIIPVVVFIAREEAAPRGRRSGRPWGTVTPASARRHCTR